jgi:ribose-phosphate pyrophosphokinase
MVEEAMIIADPKGKGFEFAQGIYDYIIQREAGAYPLEMNFVDLTEFPDGEPLAKIRHNIRRKKCFFVHDSNKDSKTWYLELNWVLEAMGSSSPSEINVVLPYFKFARQDRKHQSRVSVNAKAVANDISNYADRGMTVDLHSPQIQEFFSIPFDNLFSFPDLIKFVKLHHSEWLENLAVVSPDVGGAKRAGGFQRRLLRDNVGADLIICNKRRDDSDGINDIRVIGDVEGKNCLVLDDIIDSGGTMVETYRALKNGGAKSVIAYGTHGLFTKGVEKFSEFDKVLVSDTLYSEQKGNLEVVSMVNLFGEAIYRTIEGKSLSSLFEG